jgi:integrase
MIYHEGKKYRGISRWGNGFKFRYTDAQGCEHRVKCRSLDEAIALYHTKKDKAAKGEQLPDLKVLRQRRITFREIAHDALTYSERNKRSYATDVPRFARLKEWFGMRPAHALTPMEIEDKLDKVAQEVGWAASTLNHYRSLISLSYRLAIRNRKLTANPAHSIPHRREDNSRVRYLSENEEQTLRNVLLVKYSGHLPEFEVALQTGIRQGTQYNLTWEMVDWQSRMLHIPRTKNEEPLHIPLNDTALAALILVRARGVDNGRVFLSERTGLPLEHPRHWFDPALEEAKISGFHWHDLRPTFASRLRMKGTPLEDIADLLGHKGLAMTRRYAHLGPSRLHEVVARLVEKPVQIGTKSGTAAQRPAIHSMVSYLN